MQIVCNNMYTNIDTDCNCKSNIAMAHMLCVQYEEFPFTWPYNVWSSICQLICPQYCW